MHTLSIGGGAVRVNLLGAFNQEYGADLLGATIMRIRGILSVVSTNHGQGAILGARIDTDTTAVVDPTDGSPVALPHADWMLYEPLQTVGGGTNSTELDARILDVKSARKLEELGQGVYLWAASGIGNDAPVTLTYHLSIGLKLP